MAGLPHTCTEDDVYEGYHIPRGASVLANHWALHFDPAVYPSPHQFLPSRFIDEKGNLIGTRYSERGHHGFGFGRRICPGMHIAERTLFITFTRIMWAFDVKKPTDPTTGSEVDVDVDDFTGGFSSHPRHLETVIVPRGDWVKPVIEGAVDLLGLEPKGVSD